MVLIWLKIWLFYGLQACFQWDMIFDMVFLWCRTASIMPKNVPFQTHSMKQRNINITVFTKKCYFFHYLFKFTKMKMVASKSDVWSYFRDSGRCGSDALKFFPIWNRFP